MSIQKRRLGNTGPMVTALGLGMGRLPDRRRGPDPREAVEVVRHALACGINLFDTAPSYARGLSEVVLGQAIHDRRGEAIVVSKFGNWPGHVVDFSLRRLEESVLSSLRRLGTDYLDVLLLHNPPLSLLQQDGDEYARRLRALISTGKIRQYGVSVGSPAELTAALDKLEAQVVEVRFNAFHQAPLAAMSAAAERGVGVVVKVPLESGWLSGKDPEKDGFDAARSRRWSADEFNERLMLLQEFRAIVPTELGVLGAGLGFTLSHGCVSSVLPGARSIGQVNSLVEAVVRGVPGRMLETIKDVAHRRDLGW